MNDWDLRIFEAVARTGGLGRAALELNTVQSNVTSRMRRLEEDLQTELFERHSRGVTLSSAGERLLPYAVQILSLFEQADRAARDKGAPSGRLRLGTLETTATLRLPATLAAYTQAWPGVDLHLTTGTTDSLVQDVIERALDGAFVAGPVTHDDLAAEHIYTEELVLVTPPWATSIGELARAKDLRAVVFRVGCSYRRRLEHTLHKRGLAQARFLEFASLEAIVECVAAGIGVSLLPRGVVTPLRRRFPIAIHRLAADEAHAETVFIRRKESRVSSAMAEFLRLARLQQTAALQAAAA